MVRAWALQRGWSAAADRARARIDRTRQQNLVLLVAAAALGAVAAIIGDDRPASSITSAVAAALLASAALLQQRLMSPAQIGRWLDARIASEKLKSAVYRRLVLGPQAEAEADAELEETIDRVQTGAARHLLDLWDSPAEPGPLPEVVDVPTYIAVRAQTQADWHRRKIGDLRRKAKRLRTAELAATVCGSGVSLAAAVWSTGVLAPIVSALTTIAAVLAATLSAAKYDRIAEGYAQTVDRLDRLLGRLPTEPSPEQARAFVEDAEGVLDDQNRDWMALLSAD